MYQVVYLGLSRMHSDEMSELYLHLGVLDCSVAGNGTFRCTKLLAERYLELGL